MIKFNNSIIENAIMDALDKKERGIEVDRNELIIVILKYGDRDFGIKNGNRKYTEEELQNSLYIHIVNENNKCYIGQTSRNPKDRWESNGKGYYTQVVYRPIEKYGWDNISHIVICNRLTQEEVDEMEVALISLFKSNNREFGYNVENGGNGKGKMSEETRNKISEAQKGEKHYMYGKHHSEEARKKMSEARKGKYEGEKHPKAKKVYCNGKIFSTAIECAKFYNVKYSTMCSWLQGRRKTPFEFIDKGLRFATEEDINTHPLYIEEQN